MVFMFHKYACQNISSGLLGDHFGKSQIIHNTDSHQILPPRQNVFGLSKSNLENHLLPKKLLENSLS